MATRMTRISTLGRRFNPPEITPASILRAEEWDREQARQQARQTWREHLRDSGIPRRYQQASLKACPPEVQRYAEGFTGNTGRGLLLCGSCGTGKTTAACAVALAAAKTCTVRFVTTSDYVAMVSNFRTEREAGKYRDCRLLVLDDLGKEGSTKGAISGLYSLIDHRAGACKPTIITTNLDAAGLAAYIRKTSDDKSMAEALISRIGGKDYVKARMDGRDWRIAR